MADGMFKDLINAVENADIFFNPSKYIEREVAREFICKQMYFANSAVQSKEYDLAITHAWQGFNYVPNADVVEVVRCKDCRYGNPYLHYFYCDNNNAPWSENTMANIMDANDFCSYGERKCEDG